MAVKYVIDDETLTQIADPLRSLAGREDRLTTADMAAAGNAANTEVNTQVDLIAQISAALEGKAASGGITPAGTIEITENGEYDVAAYAKANVNVASSGGGDTDLPAGYKRVDYIQFTGEQVVDTGIICNQNTRIQLAFTREKSSQHYLYGVASSDNTASVTAYLGGSWRFGNKASTKTITASSDMMYSALVSTSEVTITGNKSAISGVNAFETIGTLLIGTCRSASGEVGEPQFVGKILFWTIQQGTELVQKLVPMVSEDGVYRFFDLVSKTFFDSITDTPLGGGNL